ncbi:hypothetical protein Q73A0000_05875 [Kaistella flava (ex Peng et al. 2021)]|uniref:Uncharacterized protein n=1 Tax=Kaistella flava (ex Peng et al. 2021) TaxID=2038776 RepID=A0A7M2Y935_9FLAO|nr:hypothetical protein [Kaistella flava (ex Peng et al. 2021)]QOW09922.1 hypothetical protein Q73A0000_05875 [Kaistella flava (ex Peng et al. 2021)]
MEKVLIDKNIVVAGEFKPSAYDKLYFIKNEILEEEDFLEDSIFLPDNSIVSTENFNIDIKFNRIIISFKKKLNSEELKLDSFLSHLSATLFGFNFKWLLIVDDFLEFSKANFFFEQNKLNHFFPESESSYGYSISSTFENSKVRLRINPIELVAKDGTNTKEALEFNFNYHFWDNYKETIQQFEKFESHSNKILSAYE